MPFCNLRSPAGHRSSRGRVRPIESARSAMAQYPTLRFLERHGDAIAILVSLCPLATGIITAWLGASAWWVLAGAAASAFLYIAARSYVEMIRLMTDMLLPK